MINRFMKHMLVPEVSGEENSIEMTTRTFFGTAHDENNASSPSTSGKTFFGTAHDSRFVWKPSTSHDS